MLRKVFMSVLCAVMVLSLTACVMEFDSAGSMLGKALEEYKESVELGDRYKGRESIELNLDMQVAKAVIDSTEDKLADVKFSYNSKSLKPEFVVEDDEIRISNKPKIRRYGQGITQATLIIIDLPCKNISPICAYKIPIQYMLII